MGKGTSHGSQPPRPDGPPCRDKDKSTLEKSFSQLKDFPMPYMVRLCTGERVSGNLISSQVLAHQASA